MVLFISSRVTVAMHHTSHRKERSQTLCGAGMFKSHVWPLMPLFGSKDRERHACSCMRSLSPQDQERGWHKTHRLALKRIKLTQCLVKVRKCMVHAHGQLCVFQELESCNSSNIMEWLRIIGEVAMLVLLSLTVGMTHDSTHEKYTWTWINIKGAKFSELTYIYKGSLFWITNCSKYVGQVYQTAKCQPVLIAGEVCNTLCIYKYTYMHIYIYSHINIDIYYNIHLCRHEYMHIYISSSKKLNKRNKYSFILTGSTFIL